MLSEVSFLQEISTWNWDSHIQTTMRTMSIMTLSSDKCSRQIQLA